MTIDIEEVTKAYKDLLIIQYSQKPKAKATIDLFVRTLLNNDIYSQVQNAFNLETAIGNQLDVIGRYVGIDRFYSLEGQLVGDFFSMTSYSSLGTDDEVGMTTYADYNTDVGGFATYEDLRSSQKLDDDTYRIFLKLRIIQNNSDHSNKSIDDGLFGFFQNNIALADQLDMTIFYFVNDSVFLTALILLVKDVLPRPMGVRLGGLINRNKKMFGFISYERPIPSQNITGFTDYDQGFTKQGEMLTYDKVILN